MIKVYFACSIRGGRDDAEIYGQIVREIGKHAHVLSEIFADGKLTPAGSPGSTRKIWEEDMSLLKEADLVIAEVTNPSLGVGYEIAKAEESGKPILALFREHTSWKLSAMIDGSPHVTVVRCHDVDEVAGAVETFINNHGK